MDGEAGWMDGPGQGTGDRVLVQWREGREGGCHSPRAKHRQCLGYRNTDWNEGVRDTMDVHLQ